MFDLIARARRWWMPDGQARGPAVPYEITCACGQVARGLRHARHQVVRCPGCGNPVFVLPRSPLLGPTNKPAPESDGRHQGDAKRRQALPPWAYPLLGAVATLAVVVAVYAVVFHALADRPPPAVPRPVEDPTPRVRAGERALAEGNFRRAADELTAAGRLLEARPGQSPAAEARRVTQLQKQASLLADLLSEPVEELPLLARRLPEEEWQAQFARRYEGRAVIFDADVTREGPGRYRLHYALRAGPEEARIQVSDLRLLGSLPANRPARLLFGARLASVRREPGGAWVIRFNPDSGVLLTDLDAARACCPPPIDEDLKAVLELQARWVDDLP